jgi:hypothetical protein
MSDAMSDAGGQRAFQVKMLYHPRAHVPDLGEAEDFFERVFGRPSVPLSSFMKTPPRPGHSTDYSTFTAIADVLFDSLDPKRYITDEIQRFETVATPHLQTLGWHVEGVPELYRELRRRAVRVTNAQDVVADGDEPPMSGPMPLLYGLPDDTGLRYELFPVFPYPADHRLQPGWSLPPVSDDDPLGIERCSHHTVLTSRPQRALTLVVDVLGGTIVHQGRDELRGTTGTFVHLADAVLEYATPDPGNAAAVDLAAHEPFDAYHAITWKVVDLARVARHLEAEKVSIIARSEDTIICDPATSLGIPWGFTTRLTPGDPRA